VSGFDRGDSENRFVAISSFVPCFEEGGRSKCDASEPDIDRQVVYRLQRVGGDSSSDGLKRWQALVAARTQQGRQGPGLNTRRE
jgi:hypothetical protein